MPASAFERNKTDDESHECPRAGSSDARLSWIAPHAVCAALLIAWFCLSPNYLRFTSGGTTPIAGDFLQEWIGGYIVWNYGADRLYDEGFVKQLQHDPEIVGFQWSKSRYFSMVYPPFYYVLLSPLSLLPYRVAAGLFTAAMIGCLFAAGYLLVRATIGKPAGCTAWMLVVALMFVPLIQSLTTGQKGTLCLLILTGTYCLLKSGRPTTAGMIFGLLAFKPQLAIVIGAAMLIKRQFRFAIGALATALCLAGICLTFGLDVCTQYYNFCRGVGEYLHTNGYHLYKSHCLYGFITLLAGGQATISIKIATLIATLLVFGMLLTALRGKIDPHDDRFNRQFSALVVATLLLSPHVFTYDLTIILLPLYLLVRAARKEQLPSHLNVPLKVLAGVMFVVAGISQTLAAVTGLQLTTLAMLGMLWVLVRDAQPSPRASRASAPACQAKAFT